MSDKKALIMLNQAPFDCDLRSQMMLLEHSAQGGALLMQDGVYFAIAEQGAEIIDRGVKLYALRQSLEARGLTDRVHPAVQLVDYHEAIDLIMEEYDLVV
jgi:tRNA 2-thiouridine synthesizing protein B